jgi:hypothetical protein
MKISKEIKDKGKAAFEKTSGVKNRGKMPPPGKAHAKKKGKGSYDRKNAFEEDEEEKDCWDGYKKKGTKKKGGKTVNNCVKENTEIQAFVEAIINEEPSKAFDHLRKAAEIKLQKRIEAEMDKPIF